MSVKYAAIDILSGRRELYAPKGAELTIHRYSGHVAFCSLNGGEQFPCHVDKLSDTKPTVINEEKIPLKPANLKTSKCCYCEIRLSNSTYSREHIIPKSKGGSKTISCCKDCNHWRSNMSLYDFSVILESSDHPKRHKIINNIAMLRIAYPEA